MGKLLSPYRAYILRVWPQSPGAEMGFTLIGIGEHTHSHTFASAAHLMRFLEEDMSRFSVHAGSGIPVPQTIQSGDFNGEPHPSPTPSQVS